MLAIILFSILLCTLLISQKKIELLGLCVYVHACVCVYVFMLSVYLHRWGCVLADGYL